MTDTDIEHKVIELIQQNAAMEVELNSQTNFVMTQILDSFAILSLIMQLEQVFAIKFSVEEIADESLQTVAGLSAAIALKLG
ncbi:acyl carrier protein [Thiomicrorhabdus indica]|uniref:acyl carrier protein n=1 Tax=Thiomicrorhabdus indica TaxID=2267253 RepID=UPI002AA95FC5|nr:acyl carrier protein [Thiomicrorhabdus indica]